jgi:hypothetical protein
MNYRELNLWNAVDDMMDISVGSTCNECADPNPENATILRASLDGKSRSIFASGLRDTVGWGWQSGSGSGGGSLGSGSFTATPFGLLDLEHLLPLEHESSSAPPDAAPKMSFPLLWPRRARQLNPPDRAILE